MTRYEWETIRQAEMNEMRQRQIRLGKRRQRGRDEAVAGALSAGLSVVLIGVAQITNFAWIVFLAVFFLVNGICSIVSGTRKWLK